MHDDQKKNEDEMARALRLVSDKGEFDKFLGEYGQAVGMLRGLRGPFGREHLEAFENLFSITEKYGLPTPDGWRRWISQTLADRVPQDCWRCSDTDCPRNPAR